MKKKLIFIAVLLLVLIIFALVYPLIVDPVKPDDIHAVFFDKNDKKVSAVFYAGESASVDLVLPDGRKFSLPRKMSASGARYADKNEDVVFWNKGDMIFIEEHGKEIFKGYEKGQSK